MKKWRVWIIVCSVCCLIIILVSYLVNQVGNKEEKVLVEFYKAVWIEANIEKAQSMLSEKTWDNISRLEAHVYLAKSDPSPATGSLLIAEIPDSHEDEKLFYVYHPEAKRTIFIILSKDGKVKQSRRINEQMSLEWKEVPLQ